MAIKTYVYKTVDSNQQLEADVHYATPKLANDAPIGKIFYHSLKSSTGLEQPVLTPISSVAHPWRWLLYRRKRAHTV